MGTEILKEEFGERDYARFRERLEQCLSELKRLLARPSVGVGAVTIGAELEACLVDDTARPRLSRGWHCRRRWGTGRRPDRGAR